MPPHVRCSSVVTSLGLLCLGLLGAAASSDAWRELGLRRGQATLQQARRAYLRLALELHPDRNREGAARGADKEERFKRVLRAYEEITACGDGPPLDEHASQGAEAPVFPGAASSMRRAGSTPTQAQHAEPARVPVRLCGGLFSSTNYDMRVFTDTVALEDMVEEPDEDGFVFECRCSGLFVLPWDEAAAEHPDGLTAVNCRLCSLWIWIRVP